MVLKAAYLCRRRRRPLQGSGQFGVLIGPNRPNPSLHVQRFDIALGVVLKGTGKLVDTRPLATLLCQRPSQYFENKEIQQCGVGPISCRVWGLGPIGSIAEL